ncbi:hypothetical protein P7C73_g3012, partial [Tremellales sp. Uapishka_1]
MYGLTQLFAVLLIAASASAVPVDHHSSVARHATSALALTHTTTTHIIPSAEHNHTFPALEHHNITLPSGIHLPNIALPSGIHLPNLTAWWSNVTFPHHNATGFNATHHYDHDHHGNKKSTKV